MSRKIKELVIVTLASAFILIMLTPNAFAWGGNVHEDMAANMQNFVYRSDWDTYAPVLAAYSVLPDYDPYQHGIYDHAYFPGLGYGNASNWGAYYTNNAEYWYQNGRQDLAFQNLGLATHYTADVSNCYHTDISGIWNHDEYEAWVSDNWDSVFSSALSNGGIIMSNPADLVVSSATNSNQRVSLFNTIKDQNPTTWRTNATLIQYTEDNIEWGSMCTNGLYFNMRGWA